MSLERVRNYLVTRGIDGHRIKEFDESSATVALAAAALGCAPERIAKTLSLLLNDHALLVVCAGDARIDNHAFKERFGTKARMLTPEQAIDLVGHAVGGVCPFAVKDGATVYLDESLRRFPTVFPACGSSNSAIELTIAELEDLSNPMGWVDVCRGWREMPEASAS